MKTIGGYFELELNNSDNVGKYWKDSVLLNSGRNCLEYILKSSNYSKVWIPYYTCDVVLEPLEKHRISFEFYDIDDNLEPIFDFSKLNKTDAFLYTNYFGLKDDFVKHLSKNVSNIIIDNAQALFSKNIPGINTFYSPRKFLGCCDGGIVYSTNKLHDDLEVDNSLDRIGHLLKRIELGAEAGYYDFKANDKDLENQPIKIMSNLSKAVINNADILKIKYVRSANFEYLHKRLKNENLLKFDFDSKATPMVYPFRTKNVDLKKHLIENKIFCATYWPNVLNWCNDSINSFNLAQEIIAIPIDQRYTLNDMELILKHFE